MPGQVGGRKGIKGLNEVKWIIPVTHHIPSAPAASGLPAPGSGHILMIMAKKRL